MTKDMTRGTPWKLIVQFALPIMAGNLLQQITRGLSCAIEAIAEAWS